MAIHIKIVLPPQALSGAALSRIQGELGGTLSLLEGKIADGLPIIDHTPPHHQLEDFIKTTGSLVHALDSLGVTYFAWINGEPVTPQHLRSTLSHKLHVLKSLHVDDERPRRKSLEED